VVFPGVVLLFLGGAIAANGETSIVLILALSVAGTMIGDSISYAAGRWGSKWLYRTRLGPSLRLGAELMSGRAKWLIPFYHLHNITRAVGPFGAGALHMPYRIWAPLDYAGAVVANTVWIGAGFVFGTAILTDDGRLEEHPAVRLGLAAIAMAWFLIMRQAFIRRMRDARARERAARSPRPVLVEVE
jgi:membrane-associated protein